MAQNHLALSGPEGDSRTPRLIRTRRVVRVLPSHSPVLADTLSPAEGERDGVRGPGSWRGRTIGRAEMKLESLLCSQHVLSSLSPRERVRVRGNRLTFGPWGRQHQELSDGLSFPAEPGVA